MRFRTIIPVALISLSSCTTGTLSWNQPDWIEVGKTTKAEVVNRYGEPDIAQRFPGGIIATYFPALTFRTQPPGLPTIQTMQPTPAGFGIATTTQIEPRLALRDGARGPREGLRIRYDAKDVAREILPE